MADELSKLRTRFGGALVDEAVQKVLVDKKVLKPGASITDALDGDAVRQVDWEVVQKYLDERSMVGKPLAPAAPRPDCEPIVCGRLGVQGNPPRLDSLYSSGWHFDQDNGWDSWFNILTIPTGGYWIATPACRPTGHHDTPTYGVETQASIDQNGRISFEVQWIGGGRGRYEGWPDDNGNIRGITYDPAVYDPATKRPKFNWYGSRMPLTAKFPRPENVPQRPPQPVIDVSADHNVHDNGYNVVVGGSGFKAGEAFQVQGRYVSPTVTGEWAMYAEGHADDFGRISATFGVIRPPDGRYVFRGFGASSGYTPEIGF